MAFRRKGMNKARSARKFRNRVGKTAALNTRNPMRGGIRL